jgi:hypothetical protein
MRSGMRGVTCGSVILFVAAGFAAFGSKARSNKKPCELPKAVRNQEEKPE